MMKSTLVPIIALLIFLVPLSASAAISPESLPSLRCGNDIATVGETQLQVLHKCGPPTSAASYPYVGRYGSASNLQQWVYNRGPADFIYQFTFLDGMLKEIKRMGRGF